ncbi:MAG: hypothetical protein QM664_04165 [Flavihumibacter sp.]
MRTYRIGSVLFFALSLVLLSACSLTKPKNGCSSNGANVGAERILAGEKVPKAKKFKA